MIQLVDTIFGYVSGRLISSLRVPVCCLFAGIYCTSVMFMCAISVSMTMLVLSLYHRVSPVSACSPVPQWVSESSSGYNNMADMVGRT